MIVVNDPVELATTHLPLLALAFALASRACYNPIVFGSLAQLVEQRTLNPRVAGSIPARPTKVYLGKKLLISAAFFILSRITRVARFIEFTHPITTHFTKQVRGKVG